MVRSFWDVLYFGLARLKSIVAYNITVVCYLADYLFSLYSRQSRQVNSSWKSLFRSIKLVFVQERYM